MIRPKGGRFSSNEGRKKKRRKRSPYLIEETCDWTYKKKKKIPLFLGKREEFLSQPRANNSFNPPGKGASILRGKTRGSLFLEVA